MTPSPEPTEIERVALIERLREREGAMDALRPYHGEDNPGGKREALVSTVDFLTARYEKARCDDEAVAGCVRCQTMFLARTMQSLLAALKQGECDG